MLKRFFFAAFGGPEIHVLCYGQSLSERYDQRGQWEDMNVTLFHIKGQWY